ncbi:MAG: pyridoxal phosphate-dependent aminotransferase [Blastocatellia bacterium]|jgi:aspartate/methionine/tyrosine aminotransferase
MFSTRLPTILTPNRLSERLAEKRRQGREILDLTVSNPTRVGLGHDGEGWLEPLGSPAVFTYDPHPRGWREARAAVAGYYRERGLGDLSPDSIHLTASSSEGYAFLFKLLADQGESVLVPQPSYPLFEWLAALEGVELVPYPLEYFPTSGWRIDLQALRQAITPRVRAVIVVSPNNPTGSFLREEERVELMALGERHGLAIIADEVFGDYGWGEDPARVETLVGETNALTFVLSGLSKVLALPQMKLGWIVTTGPPKLAAAARERLDLIADTYLSVGTPVQAAVGSWLARRQLIQAPIRKRLQTNLQMLIDQVAAAPGAAARLFRVDGGWSVPIEIPRYHTDEEWALFLLDEDDLLVHPGYFFDFPQEGVLVLSLLPEPERFREGVARLLSRIERE